MVPRMLERYRNEVVPKLTEEFGYMNIHQVPSLTKIVVNVGLGEATQNGKLLEVDRHPARHAWIPRHANPPPRAARRARCLRRCSGA